MARGGIGGRHLRGGLAGVDTTDVAAGWEYHRRASAGAAALDNAYAAGCVFPNGVASGGIGNSNLGGNNFLSNPAAGLIRLFATPEVFPRATRITALNQQYGGASVQSATNRVRMGIYSNAGDGNPYPGDLLVDSGEFALGAGAASRIQASVDVSVAAGTLLWFVFGASTECFTNAVTVHLADEKCYYPLLGTPVHDALWAASSSDGFDWAWPGSNGTLVIPGLGWKTERAYGTLPSTWPAASLGRTVVQPITIGSNGKRVPMVWWRGSFT